ncbi:alpha/beta fold hydrolase [Actinopolymorpha pittospori]
MTSFVLIHGAWCGGWVWKHVASALRAPGNDVWTPTLTGLGERAHLASPQVGLATHVDDVVRMLEYEDLTDVVLVGHSYGGMVVTGVCDRVPERISQLVYLDGFVPRDGQSLHDLVPAGGARHNRELARREGDGWRIPLEDEWRTASTEENLRWMNPRWTDHPLRCFEEPVRLTRPLGAGVSCSYIRCTANRETEGIFDPIASGLTDGWRVYELPTVHAAMEAAPREVAELLREIAGTSPAADPRATSPIENRVGMVFIPVRDMRRSIAWYSTLLGLPVGDASHQGTIYDLPTSGEVNLALDANKPDFDIAGPPRFFWWATDLDACLAHLKANDVEVEGEIEDIGSLSFLQFRDPDGNLLMVCGRNTP